MSDGRFLPYGRQTIGEDDIAAVVEVLRSDFLTTGPVVAEFEAAFAACVGAAHAVAVSSGTAALHLAALALDLGPGDCAVVPAITFVATANAVRHAGAEVVFADVDPDTGLMGPRELEGALARTGDGTVRAVFPVHLNGQPCDMPAISAIARRRGIEIVEDACHALGGTIESEPVGNGKHGRMAMFSLHPVKAIAMGEGGVLTTNDGDCAARLRRLRNHGLVHDHRAFTNAEAAYDPDGTPHPWYYELHEPGLNYRASDIHCALGRSQLSKLDGFLARRRALADAYDRALAGLDPLLRPVPRVGRASGGWHLYPVLVDFEAAGTTRDAVMRALRADGIGTQVHYFPVHRQPYYAGLCPGTDLPGADRYYARCLSLPLFPAMADDDVARVAGALTRALAG